VAGADGNDVHAFGGLNPEKEQLRRLIEGGLAGPLQFVNLLAYRETAEYPSDHERAGDGLSGGEAYALYAEVALEQVLKRGGHVVSYAEVELTLVGADDGWDQIAVREYPTVDAFLDMIADPDYQAALVHREAGLARTGLVVTRSLLPRRQ
jgi:uncharacterized protein (DUF1330 family)